MIYAISYISRAYNGINDKAIVLFYYYIRIKLRMTFLSWCGKVFFISETKSETRSYIAYKVKIYPCIDQIDIVTTRCQISAIYILTSRTIHNPSISHSLTLIQQFKKKTWKYN